MHDYAQALQHFQAAQRWTPNDPVLSRNIGLAAFQSGDHQTSIHALTDAIIRQPDDALARAFLGRSLFAVKRYAEAARSLAPLADSIYSDPTLAYTYAVALARSQQEAPARTVLVRLLEMSLPPAAISQICQVYVELKDTATAAQCLRRSGGVQSPNRP
jgi:tetratricopeptide (TPR) repeat protein